MKGKYYHINTTAIQIQKSQLGILNKPFDGIQVVKGEVRIQTTDSVFLWLSLPY